jgi:hypothetical protein
MNLCLEGINKKNKREKVSIQMILINIEYLTSAKLFMSIDQLKRINSMKLEKKNDPKGNLGSERENDGFN